MIKLENIGSLVTYNSNLGIMDTLNDIEIIIDNDLILEIGNNLRKIDNVINCNHKLVTPGFVDPHTHPVFLNPREDEFNMSASPLLQYSLHNTNVLITPHVGGCTYESMEATEIFIAQQFAQVYSKAQ